MIKDELNTRTDLLYALNHLDEWPEIHGRKVPHKSQWIADLIYHLAVDGQLPETEQVCTHACANLGIPFGLEDPEEHDNRPSRIRHLISFNYDIARKRMKEEKHAAMLAAGWSEFTEELLFEAYRADRQVLLRFPLVNRDIKCRVGRITSGLWATPGRYKNSGYTPTPGVYARIIYTERKAA